MARKVLQACLHLYYRFKIALLTLLVGPEAIAYVLRDSLLPLLVLRIGGAKIGQNIRIGRRLTLHETKGTFRNLDIGNDASIGSDVLIDLSDTVTLGDRCSIAMRVAIITHLNYPDSKLSAQYPRSTAPVEIKEDAVVDWGCVVLKGTTINRKVLVLPRSVVTGMLSEASVYDGNPARPVLWRKDGTTHAV